MSYNCTFDAQDHALVELVRSFTKARTTDESDPQFDSISHPHGIIELTSSHSMRIAHALIILLNSLTMDDAQKRLLALRRLYDEVMQCGSLKLRHNSGRVLIELMKDIIRCSDEERSLQLAHDFHAAARGLPRTVRYLLDRYNLLEMPEEWNQQAFDHHVHDAHTKGRKTPTHLVMDAWIKGIRFLTVLYYNKITKEAVDELLQAARIMGITVRVGIEFRAAYRGSFIHIIWSPLEHEDPEQFAMLIDQPAVQALFADYEAATVWRRQHLLALLAEWNTKHRHAMAMAHGIAPPPPITEQELLAFIGERTPILLHLAEGIKQNILAHGCEEERPMLASITAAEIMQRWLGHDVNPHIIFPKTPHASMPEVLLRSPEELIKQLSLLPTAQIILQLTHLTEADVLELLWRAKGSITHLELFNVKDWADGHLGHIQEINTLQRTINDGSTPELKHLVQTIIAKHTNTDENQSVHDQERSACFLEIQRNIVALQRMYSLSRLKSRLGTDSSSHAYRSYGMGLAFIETLPPKAKQIAKRKENGRLILPIFTEVYKFIHIHTLPSDQHNNGLSFTKTRKETGWALEKSTTTVSEQGNLVTLGGIASAEQQALIDSDSISKCGYAKNLQDKKDANMAFLHRKFAYLNSNVVNTLKIIAGFLPAQLAFMYTDAWWFLVYFGALIWFFITGARNIVQATLSAGGVRKRLLISWKRCVDWGRVSDSLLYTGFSVLLLEVIVRVWLIEKTLNLNVANSALLIYFIMAAVNGCYIASHNIFRGFPRQAVVGNLFRSILAVPVAFVFGEILLMVSTLSGTANPELIVQTCAAITSKCASDTVAAVIEGFADKNKYISLRRWDYTTKFAQIYQNFSRQELLFAKKNILDYSDTPEKLWEMLLAKNPHVAHEAVINMLDMLYFWHYLPRARQVLREQLRHMPSTEKRIICSMHNFLTLEREICSLILQGAFGKKYTPILSFYLRTKDNYLHEIQKIAR